MRLSAVLAFALGSSVAVSAAAQSRPTTQALMGAAFAPAPRYHSGVDRLLQTDSFDASGAPLRWRTDEVNLGRAGGAVDRLRISVGQTVHAPGRLPLALDRADADDHAYEVAFVRDWPGAVSFEAGAVDVDVTPHAGLGLSNLGGTAEAGATLTVGQKREQAVVDRLRGWGVGDGARFGEQGRWYLFAAASGRAVGLNMLRDDRGWDRAGWTTDPTSALVGDAHLGVGWRKGDLQTSFGYIHREVKGENMVFGQKTREDSLVAFSLTLKPGS